MNEDWYYVIDDEDFVFTDTEKKGVENFLNHYVIETGCDLSKLIVIKGKKIRVDAEFEIIEDSWV